MAIVYRHYKKCNNETFYIGIGKDVCRAMSKRSRNKHWHNITRKYDYSIEITHRNLNWEEACSIERYFIAFYGRKDLGLGTLVNLTDGGDGTINIKPRKKYVYSDEIKLKVSLGKIGKKRKPFSAEHHLKLSLAKIGNTNASKKNKTMECKK